MDAIQGGTMTMSTGPTSSTASTTPHLNYPWLAHYPKGVNWHQQIAPAPLYQLLDRAADRHPARICTNFLGRTISYGEMSRLVDKAAAGLAAIGVTKGTKVGLFLPNSPTFIVFYYATLKAGGTVVNYNPLYTLEELTFQVKDSETEIMVTLDLKLLFDKVEALMAAGTLKQAIVASFPALLPTAKSILFRLFKGKDLASVKSSKVAGSIISEDSILANDGKFAAPAINPTEDVAVLQYTGGTTGTPKGAMLTHAAVYTNVLQTAAWAPELKEAEERVLGVLPFFHVFAMTVVMNFAIAKAAEILIMPRFVLDDALKLIDKAKPTIMPGVPTLFNAVMNHPKLKSFDLSSLKFCLSGGAALPI
jgi:long-chain acyl-CoA synthetase